MNEHIEKVTHEFTKQAKTFNEYQKDMTKQQFTDFAVKSMKLTGDEDVLEVAAGTCIFGRSVAEFVRHITEFDITKAMLEVGKIEAEKQNIHNVSFVTGMAEELPFLEQSFDIVMSRLAFHHFDNHELAFSQMAKVVKQSGKIVVIDIQAREDELRDEFDRYELLRDSSHTSCISKEEIEAYAKKSSLSLEFFYSQDIPVKLSAWLDLTKIKNELCKDIEDTLRNEISGGKKTGFEPYFKGDEICFTHRWMLCIFGKNKK